MAEIPKVEPQSSAQALRDRKAMVASARQELEAVQASLARAQDLARQNEFFEAQIGNARGRIFMLILAQTRQGEVRHAEAYIEQLDSAVADWAKPKGADD